jgi:recombination protein RecA
MSSAMVSAAAAQGRLFFFDDGADPDVRSLGDSREHVEVQESPIVRFLQSTIKNQKSKILAASITPASRLSVRPAPEMLSSGIAAINALTGGWPRGCLTEICGPASSGRTTLLLAALAAATSHGEFCVLVDASDALDPRSVAEAGVELDRLLWVRCGEDAPQKARHKQGCPISRASFAREACPEPVERVGISSHVAFDSDHSGSKENSSRQSDRRLEQVLHVTDLLLESGGFGLVVLDLSDLPPQQARRIPLTTWFRFRRAVEHTPTVLLAIEQQPIAGSCSSLQLQLGAGDQMQRMCLAPINENRAAAVLPDAPVEANPDGIAAELDFPYPAHAQLLTGLEITAELIRSRLERKPARSTAAFASKTAWAG